MEEFEIYEELGLTKNEAKVYEVLVKFGKLGAGEISGKADVSYSKIYNILDSLINKELVNVIPEKSKKFVPSDPQSLIKLIEEKRAKLDKAKDKVKEMKKFYEIKEKNPVIMSFGKKGFYKIVTELKEVKSYRYVIKWGSEYRPNWIGQTRRDLKKGIDIKNLVRYDRETEKNVKKYMKVNKNVRIISNEGVAISINGDEEIMIALIKSNVTLLIKDKPFIKIMKKMFEETYKNAEEIK